MRPPFSRESERRISPEDFGDLIEGKVKDVLQSVLKGYPDIDFTPTEKWSPADRAGVDGVFHFGSHSFPVDFTTATQPEGTLGSKTKRTTERSQPFVKMGLVPITVVPIDGKTRELLQELTAEQIERADRQTIQAALKVLACFMGGLRQTDQRSYQLLLGTIQRLRLEQ